MFRLLSKWRLLPNLKARNRLLLHPLLVLPKCKKEQSRRMAEKKDIDTAFLKRAIQVLETVLDEFDTDDADHDQGLLKTAFSTLIDEEFLTVNLKGFGL